MESLFTTSLSDYLSNKERFYIISSSVNTSSFNIEISNNIAERVNIYLDKYLVNNDCEYLVGLLIYILDPNLNLDIEYLNTENNYSFVKVNINNKVFIIKMFTTHGVILLCNDEFITAFNALLSFINTNKLIVSFRDPVEYILIGDRIELKEFEDSLKKIDFNKVLCNLSSDIAKEFKPLFFEYNEYLCQCGIRAKTTDELFYYNESFQKSLPSPSEKDFALSPNGFFDDFVAFLQKRKIPTFSLGADLTNEQNALLFFNTLCYILELKTYVTNYEINNEICSVTINNEQHELKTENFEYEIHSFFNLLLSKMNKLYRLFKCDSCSFILDRKIGLEIIETINKLPIQKKSHNETYFYKVELIEYTEVFSVNYLPVTSLKNEDFELCELINFDFKILALIKQLTYEQAIFGQGKKYDIEHTIFNEKFHCFYFEFSNFDGDVDSFLDDLRNKIKQLGYYPFISENRTNNHAIITVLKTNNIIADVVSYRKPNGGNYGIEYLDIIEKLTFWDKKYNIDILEVLDDLVTFYVKDLPNDDSEYLLFANELYDFCPDIINQGAITKENLVSIIENNKKITLWWD